MTTLLRLYRAEWLKLRRAPLTLILLGIFLALLVVQMGAQFLIVLLARGVELTFLAPAQLASYTAGATLPGSFAAALSHVNGLGGVFAIILAAGALGSEYSWGTLRASLLREPARGLTLLAKAAAIMTLLAVAVSLALAVGGLLGLLGGTLLGTSGSLSAATVATLPLALLRALYVFLPYVLLTLMFTVLGRSTLMGVAGGLVYLTFEVGLGGLTVADALGGFWKMIYNMTIGQNINTLVVLNSRAFGIEPAVSFSLAELPSPLQATLVVALYSLSFLVSAIWLLRRSDIRGAV